MAAIGRPKIYDVEDIIEKLNTYIDETEEPMVIEFTLNYRIGKTQFYQLAKNNEELANSIKRLTQKEEMFLLKNAERQKINPVFAMFRLKQPAFGYKDKQEVESQNTNVNLNKDVSNLSDAELEAELKKLDK